MSDQPTAPVENPEVDLHVEETQAADPGSAATHLVEHVEEQIGQMPDGHRDAVRTRVGQEDETEQATFTLHAEAEPVEGVSQATFTIGAADTPPLDQAVFTLGVEPEATVPASPEGVGEVAAEGAREADALAQLRALHDAGEQALQVARELQARITAGGRPLRAASHSEAHSLWQAVRTRIEALEEERRGIDRLMPSLSSPRQAEMQARRTEIEGLLRTNIATAERLRDYFPRYSPVIRSETPVYIPAAPAVVAEATVAAAPPAPTESVPEAETKALAEIAALRAASDRALADAGRVLESSGNRIEGLDGPRLTQLRTALKARIDTLQAEKEGIQRLLPSLSSGRKPEFEARIRDIDGRVRVTGNTLRRVEAALTPAPAVVAEGTVAVAPPAPTETVSAVPDAPSTSLSINKAPAGYPHRLVFMDAETESECARRGITLSVRARTPQTSADQPSPQLVIRTPRGETVVDSYHMGAVVVRRHEGYIVLDGHLASEDRLPSATYRNQSRVLIDERGDVAALGQINELTSQVLPERYRQVVGGVFGNPSRFALTERLPAAELTTLFEGGVSVVEDLRAPTATLGLRTAAGPVTASVPWQDGDRTSYSFGRNPADIRQVLLTFHRERGRDESATSEGVAQFVFDPATRTITRNPAVVVPAGIGIARVPPVSPRSSLDWNRNYAVRRAVFSYGLTFEENGENLLVMQNGTRVVPRPDSRERITAIESVQLLPDDRGRQLKIRVRVVSPLGSEEVVERTFDEPRAA